MKILVSAVLGVLAASAAYAGDEPKPYNVSNGRATQTTRSSQPKIFVVGEAPGGGAAANTGAPETPTAVAAGGGGRAFAGAGGGRSSRGVRKSGHKSFWGGKVRGADGGGSADEAPPNFSKPGALIRTTGQAPKYEAPSEAPRTHTADAGAIVMNDRKAYDVGKAPTVQVGPKDTLPPPNPGTTSKTYTGGAAANGPVGGTGGSGSNSGGQGTLGGHDNNGSGNNDRNIPQDTPDQQGGDKLKEAAFYDAF